MIILLIISRNRVTLYDDEVFSSSKEFSLEPSLVMAIIRAESNFNKNAVSVKGACGLMQLTPKTYAYMCESLSLDGFEDKIMSPHENIYVGCAYLGYLFLKFETETEVIAAYNAGEGNVSKWLEDEKYSHDGKTLCAVPYKETKNYLEKVKKYKKIYDRKNFNYESSSAKGYVDFT